jgi:hypothetical protein
MYNCLADLTSEGVYEFIFLKTFYGPFGQFNRSYMDFCTANVTSEECVLKVQD